MLKKVRKSQKKLKKLSKNAKSRVKNVKKRGGGGVQSAQKKGTIYYGKIFRGKTMIKYWKKSKIAFFWGLGYGKKVEKMGGGGYVTFLTNLGWGGVRIDQK